MTNKLFVEWAGKVIRFAFWWMYVAALPMGKSLGYLEISWLAACAPVWILLVIAILAFAFIGIMALSAVAGWR